MSDPKDATPELPEIRPEDFHPPGYGIRRKLLIGCNTIMLLLLGVTVFMALTLNKSVADGFTSRMEAMLQRMDMPTREREEILKPVRAFSEKIRAGDVDPETGIEVLRTLTEGPIVNLFMIHAFEHKLELYGVLSFKVGVTKVGGKAPGSVYIAHIQQAHLPTASTKT